MHKKLLMPAVSAAAIAAAMPQAVLMHPRADVAGDVAAVLAEVKAELAKVVDPVRRTAEDALAQHAKTGEVSAAIKAQADEQLTKFNTLSASVNKLEGQLEALETSNRDLAQALAVGGRGGAQPMQSAGQEIAASEDFQNWIKGGLNGAFKIAPKAAITSAAGQGGGLIDPDYTGDVVNMPRRTLRMRSLLIQATTDSDVVKFAKQTTRTQNGGMTAEGVAATASVFGWTDAEANVRKIVALVAASDEALADAGQLRALIDSELRYELDLKEDTQILAGDGTGQNLSGLVTGATGFVAAAGLPNATHIDRLRLGILQLALANYAADGITLHPTDWSAIELLKDTTGRYIFGDPNTQSTPRLWGADVVSTLAHSAGEWMVGAFRISATLYDRADTEVLISSENSDNFVTGHKTIKATKRLALADRRPAARVTGNFTFA